MNTKHIDFDIDYTTGRMSFPTMTDARNAERAIQSHAALLEAAERAKSTFELFASQGGRLAEEAEIKVAYLSAAIAKAKAEQS